MPSYNGTCLGDASLERPGNIIPDMGPCKRRIPAVSRFEGVRVALHESHGRLQKTKRAEIAQLESAWRAAAVWTAWERDVKRAENQRLVTEPESEAHHFCFFSDPLDIYENGKCW